MTTGFAALADGDKSWFSGSNAVTFYESVGAAIVAHSRKTARTLLVWKNQHVYRGLLVDF